MSAERATRIAAALAALALTACAAAEPADEEVPPDVELLEYLGSWDGSDEDWLLVSDEKADAETDDERSAPARDGEESQESEHES